MRQQLPVLLAILLALVLGWAGYRYVFEEGLTTELRVVEAVGEVSRVDEAGHTEAAEAGEVLNARDRVVVGSQGHAVVQVGEGTGLTLGAATSIRVLGIESSGVRIELEEGRVQARVRPGSPLLGLSNRGRGVEARDAEFTMAIEADGGLLVQSERGSLDLQGLGEVAILDEGQRLRAPPDKDPLLAPIPKELLLQVQWPERGTTREEDVELSGHTEPYARVVLSGAAGEKALRAGPDGRFSGRLPLEEGDNSLLVQVQDGLGGEVEDKGTMSRDSKPPSVTSAEVLYPGG